MNNLIHYQAFIEKKNILAIETLILDISEFVQDNNNVTGTLNVNGVIFTNNLDNKEEFCETLSFNLEIKEKITKITIFTPFF